LDTIPYGKQQATNGSMYVCILVARVVDLMPQNSLFLPGLSFELEYDPISLNTAPRRNDKAIPNTLFHSGYPPCMIN
jgi:hypothetical protein